MAAESVVRRRQQGRPAGGRQRPQPGAKEIAQRYDFKSVGASIEWSGEQRPDEGQLRGAGQRRPRRLPDQADQARDLAEGPRRRASRSQSGKEYRIEAVAQARHQPGERQEDRQDHPRRGPEGRQGPDQGRRAAGRQPRAATTCRPSSPCSRARTSTSRCSSSTTAERTTAAPVHVRTVPPRSARESFETPDPLGHRRVRREQRRHAAAAERVGDHQVRHVHQVAVGRQRRSLGPTFELAQRRRERHRVAGQRGEPSSSASYSRVRQIASWTSIAAIGARRTIASMRERVAAATPRPPPPPKNSSICATSGDHPGERRGDRGGEDVAVVDVHQLVAEHPAQLALVEQPSGCPRCSRRRRSAGCGRWRRRSGPRSARRRAAASAGAAAVESSRTMRYIAGCSTSLTGRACIARIAILSEFQ